MATLAYLLFALSGAAGLIYESVWSRYLALIVGHTAYAQVLVLTIFLGGMAVGAVLAGVYSERLRDPLKLYATAELLIGLLGVAFHGVFVAVSSLAYETIFPAIGTGVLLTIVKWSVAAVLILPQSVILGTTFPLMAAAVIRRLPRKPGRVLGLLYFSNNLGAASGVLLAGFVLLALGGLPGSILTAAVINLLVAAAAYVLALRFPLSGSQPRYVPGAASEGDQGMTIGANSLVRLLLAVSFGTAAASFCYEIGWLRMLALVLGSATHTFEIMLSAFIFGLALGSFWIRNRADSLAEPLRALGVVQWIMGLTALATLPLYAATFGWTEWLLEAFANSDAGFLGLSVGKYGISLAIMLPSTICAGMTLPLITRTLLVGGGGERSIGSVYGANTVGSIAGVALAGLVILPWVGVRNLIIGGAILDMAIGVALLFVAARSAKRVPFLAYGSAVMVVGAVLLVAILPRVEREVLSAGVFRYGNTRPGWMGDIRYYRDGRTATVSAYETVEPRRIIIATNGKPDGSLPMPWLGSCSNAAARLTLSGDVGTEMLGPLITLAHAPNARRGAVVGHGTGMSGHFMLGLEQLEQVTSIEIEPRMIDASRVFYPANARVFDDPRSRIVIEDARTHFATAEAAYDAIFSEPSNPWVSGVASLFTTEFYAHVANSLTDAGVFGQWLHLYEIDDSLVLSVIAAIDEQFARYALFRTSGGDLLILASKSEELPEPDWSIFESPMLESDLCHLHPITADDLNATRVADDVVFAALLERWQTVNSDFQPHLDLGADRARLAGAQADGFLGLGVRDFDVAAALMQRRMGPSEKLGRPAANIARLVARSNATYLRHLNEDGVEVAPWSGLAQSLYTQGLWHALVASDSAPVSWREWLEHFRSIAAERSAGIAGVPDSALYGTALSYLATAQAPLIVQLAVTLQQSLTEWDFRLASRTLDQVLSETNRLGWSMQYLVGWIPATTMVEGGVIAKLAVGDRRGAGRLYDALEPYYDRPPDHLKRMLIESLLD